MKKLVFFKFLQFKRSETSYFLYCSYAKHVFFSCLHVHTNGFFKLHPIKSLGEKKNPTHDFSGTNYLCIWKTNVLGLSNKPV